MNDLGAGMMAGTSPSINAYDEIAFQANTGNLWTTAHGDTGLGMAWVSPSIDAYGAVAFHASDGDLWTWDGTNGVDRDLAMMAGTSPRSIPA